MRAQVAGIAIPTLFSRQIPWGEAEVLSATVDSAEKAGLLVARIDPLADVDRTEDVAVWDTVLAQRDRARENPRVSAVVPTLNEESDVVRAIESARAAGVHEVLVADGGSTDSTIPRAEAAGALVVRAPRGRASQMNAGAAIAAGDAIVFLHADTILPNTALADIRRALQDDSVAAGAFRYSAGDPRDATDRLITLVGGLRYALFGLPYGDQALFVRRRDFEDLGGFPDIPTMEDYEFATRVARLGRIATATSEVHTSTRAWRNHGLVRTTLTNMAVIAGYRAGIPAERLAAWRRPIAR
ncbi:MAG: TIGR04283 family arsenosugar biosynthesis glycosyltransferase, partial [Coriobacteriia bacterium]|nr:TIGR04283 family arsenosugar biosynthesis glycosyltransferase [Coriobacteriia bacterium]